MVPPFTPLSHRSFTWGDVDGDSFISSVNSAYEEIVHWRRNVFSIPSGDVGKDFICESTCLFNSLCAGNPLEAIALKAIAVMTHLLLQKPYHKSKSKENLHYFIQMIVALAQWPHPCSASRIPSPTVPTSYSK
jgi:hypothetical protein